MGSIPSSWSITVLLPSSDFQSCLSQKITGVLHMPMETSTAPVLVMTDITKTFGGVHALKGVNFDLKAGEVQALVGQNGAGKSTLIKILAGAIAPDAGSMQFDGKQIAFSSPSDALHLGIGTVYQDPLV